VDRGNERYLYQLLIPGLAVVNLSLAAFLLGSLHPVGQLGWLVVCSGAFCCVVAGWLGGSLWSKSYWAQVMARQIDEWRRMADTIIEWIEDLPVPSEAIDRLRHRLEEPR
jgi:hypothetical protein